MTDERRLELAKVFNFRDLGGYHTAGGQQTKWRALYRADGVHRLSGDDLEAVRVLGLRTVLDLRTPDEIETRGRFPVDDHPVDWHHLPMITAAWDPEILRIEAEAEVFLADRYLEMLEQGADAIRTALTLLADPESYPALFHCAAGKDRTGVLAALVLALVGVSDDDVADDYGMSAASMESLIAWLAENFPEARDAMVNQPSAFMQAPAGAMHRFLDAVRARYGSVEGFVTDDLGVDPGVIDGVRAALLEP
jgi:protein-tyrosine phosphatase